MNLASLVGQIVGIINLLIKLCSAVAFASFMYGMFRYVYSSGGNTGAKKVGHDVIIWGIVGLVVMFCLYGIVNLAARAVFGDTVGSAPVPIAQDTGSTLDVGSGSANTGGGGGGPGTNSFHFTFLGQKIF